MTACFSVERNPGGRRDPVGGGAAGNQHQDQIIGAGGIGHGKRFEGRGKAGGIGHGMPRFHDPHAARGTAVAVTGHRYTADAACRQATLVEIVTLRHLGHRTGGLAGGQNQQASGCGGCGQMRRQAACRMRGRNRGAEQVFQEGARGRGHGVGPETMRGLPWRGNGPLCICFAIACIENSTCEGLTHQGMGAMARQAPCDDCSPPALESGRLTITILSVVRSENLQDPSW